MSAEVLEKKIKFENISIYHGDEESTLQTVDEVLYNQVYNFPDLYKSTNIIDLGANIGVSCAFFKRRASGAKVLCVEPDPASIEYLKKNIEKNNWDNVAVKQAAVSMNEGEAYFYGQVSGLCEDARGNSLLQDWGLQRKISRSIVVKTIQLSTLIDAKVSVLKMDIEGAEEMVLKEARHKLHLVENIFIEFHGSKSLEKYNKLSRILKLLQDLNFEVDIVDGEIGIFPCETLDWASDEMPYLCLIKGRNRAYDS